MRCVLPLLFALSAAISGCAPLPAPAAKRLVVIGFDGMDPALVEAGMREGRLPHLAALAASGSYQHLPTTLPPQSPVAWASFATGTDPGAHGLFDFLHRNASNYQPDFSITQLQPAERINLFGWEWPLGDDQLSNRRDGTPLWSKAEQVGVRATVLRVPVTFPPDPITRMLSGMGVPDLLGSQGTYTVYATRPIPGAENGGRVVLMQADAEGVINTRLDGPAHPFDPNHAPLSLPLQLRSVNSGVAVRIGSEEFTLQVGQWSEWIHLEFPFSWLGSARGMVRAYLIEAYPRPWLYLSPIHLDPGAPAVPFSAPEQYAADLQNDIDDFHTLGMPEETWSFNQGHLPESAWLESAYTTMDEGEAMLIDALARHDSELVIKVFVQVDRVSHMFWRARDPLHPLYAAASPQARSAIDEMYQASDAMLGRIRATLDPGDELMVLSDHGFASFRHAVHLNRWLLDQGYLALKPGATTSEPLFASVDWLRTRAYALGLNGVFINRSDREAQGIVTGAEALVLKQEIRGRLRDWLDDQGSAIVPAVFDADEVYSAAHREQAPDLIIGYAPGYRASWQTSLGGVPEALLEDNRQPWSGDHCIDPAAVPGVLFTSFALQHPVAGITRVSDLILQRLGVAQH